MHNKQVDKRAKTRRVHTKERKPFKHTGKAQINGQQQLTKYSTSFFLTHGDIFSSAMRYMSTVFQLTLNANSALVSVGIWSMMLLAVCARHTMS